MTPADIARLAAMGNLLRPDWPERSLHTFLASKCGHRPVKDVAVALAWIATDGETKTPARLNEAGPWWQASATSTSALTEIPPPIDELCDHGRKRDLCGCGTRMVVENDWPAIAARGKAAALAAITRPPWCPTCHAKDGRHGGECPNRVEESA